MDGGSHRDRKGRDRRRDTRMALQDVRTLRYSNHRVLTDLDGVVAEIEEAINARNGPGPCPKTTSRPVAER
jgi:very-short-patch-repair endonuclease